MHLDRRLIEARIARERADRLAPLAIAERRPLTARAGPALDQLAPIVERQAWGPAWATTWFEFAGEIPDGWEDGRIEAEIDLGFTRAGPGFQCEGLVVDAAGQPVQGLHPRRRRLAVDARPGPVTIRVEAASNPTFRQFEPSPMGSPDTAGDQPLYRFGSASLVLVDGEAEALLHDLDVLDGLLRALAHDDSRRDRLIAELAALLDAVATGSVGTARAIAGAALARTAAPRAHRVFAVGHAHIDTAWLWPTRETVRKCTRTFASAIGLMERYPEFRFACSQAQQYLWIERHQPQLFQRIRAKVASGQWLPVGGMWVEADMNLPSGESLARQIVFGQRYFEQRFGARCTEVWIPDVFGYPATMPQLYAAGGMRRFITQKLSWNTTNRFPHHTFWWEGIDGTRVLAHFPPVDTYNAELTPIECAESVRRFRDGAWSDVSLMPFGYGDGGGGPTPDMLERARRMADLDGVPRLTIGSPAEFFDAVEAEVASGADVPVWRGELYFETHRGTLTSQLRTKLGNRRCERLLGEVELWAATLGRHVDLAELWQRVLTQQFHDIIPGSSIAWVHADAERELADVADRLESELDQLLAGLVPAGRHAVNAAGVERDEVVEVEGAARRVRIGARSIAALDAIGFDDGDRVVATEHSLTNRHVSIRWDLDGNLTSVIDLASARELIPAGRLGAVLELAPDQPVQYDAWDVESWTPGLGHPLLEAERVELLDSGPAIGRLRVTRRFGASLAVVVYTISAGARRVDVDVSVEWHHDEHLLSIVFPFDVRTDTATCDIQFGHVRRPTHRSTSWDAAKFEVAAHRFVDLSEPSFGVAVLNDGRYGHGVFDAAIRVSLARAARYPDPHADRGRHEVRLAVLAHGAGLSDVVVEAQRLCSPLRIVDGGRAAAAPAPLVTLGAPRAGAVEVDAVKLADDASGDVIVRLHEALGDRTRVTVACDRPISAAAACNLMEEPQAAIDVGDGICAIVVRPFELVTLRLTRA